jgi:hypothetical protein
MEKRVKRARRLLDVLSQLQRLEEQRKIELQRKQRDLETSQEEIIKALNNDDALHGLFIDTTARLLKRLSQEARRVEEARDKQSLKLLERAAKVKTAERLHERLDYRAARVRKEEELRDIIERYVGRTSASLPQD